MDIKILLLGLLFGFINQCHGQLRCYSCSFNSVDTDRTCLTISNSTPVVDCYLNYCTIFRQEFADPAGEVASFLRGCEQTPDFLNHDVTDAFFRTYYRACTSDLCNIGDGIQSVVGGTLSAYPEYNGINLLVPGTGAAATTTTSILTLFMVMVVLICSSF